MLKLLFVFAALSMATPVMAAHKVTCEGILENGSAGDYIGTNPQCWLGRFQNEVEDVCGPEPQEHCKITGIAIPCGKTLRE